MSNTRIQLRKSGASGNTPADLNYGEVAINYADGKLFYKNGVGIKAIQNQDTFSTINVNNSLILATSPTDILNLVAGNNIALSACTSTKTITVSSNALANVSGTTFDGDLNVDGKLSVLTTGGDEGGEILLGKAESNTTLIGVGVTIDVYQNKLRFFEQGGSARGFFLDISSGAGGASTDIMGGGGGGTTDTAARNSASAAYERANASYIQANAAFVQANAANNLASSAYDSSNTNSSLITILQGVNNTQNTNITAVDTYATSSYAQANAANNLSSSAYDKANSANVLAQSAYDRANSSILRVATIGEGNVISNVVTSVTGINFDSLSGFIVDDLGSGNVKVSLGSTFKTWKVDGQTDLVAQAEDIVRFGAANGITITTSNTVANGKSITFSGYPIFSLANTASSNTIYLQGVNDTQNTNISDVTNYATSGYAQANAATNSASAAYVQANASNNLATSSYTQANAANNLATSGYVQANAANNMAVGAFIQANDATNSAQSSYNQANAATNSASASYDQANAANNLATSGYAQANAATNSAQSSYDQANAANNLASSAYDSSNTNSGLITILQGVNTTQNTNITAVDTYATSAYAQANAATNSASAAYERANASFVQANVGATFVSSGGTVSGNVVISNDLSVTGNLYVLGNTVSINTTSFSVQDALITLAVGNYTTDLLDIGFAAHYNAGTNAHTGIIRDHTTKEYYVFDEYTPELDATNNINIADPSFATANINADYFKGNLIATSAVVNGYNIFNYSSNSFAQANAATNSATAAYERSNASFIQANAAFVQANSTNTYAYSAYAAANAASNKANSAIQIGFTTISANGVSVTPTSNTDTLTITAGNNISILANSTTKTITFNAVAGTSSTYSYTASATPPSSPDAGDHWYNTSSDILYEYINDGTSNYWVDITSTAISTTGTSITNESVDILNPFLLAGM